MANEFVLTRKGKEELEQKLEYLKTVKRAEISEQIKIARGFGDLSEKRAKQNRRSDRRYGEAAAQCGCRR